MPKLNVPLILDAAVRCGVIPNTTQDRMAASRRMLTEPGYTGQVLISATTAAKAKAKPRAKTVVASTQHVDPTAYPAHWAPSRKQRVNGTSSVVAAHPTGARRLVQNGWATAAPAPTTKASTTDTVSAPSTSAYPSSWDRDVQPVGISTNRPGVTITEARD